MGADIAAKGGRRVKNRVRRRGRALPAAVRHVMPDGRKSPLRFHLRESVKFTNAL